MAGPSNEIATMETEYFIDKWMHKIHDSMGMDAVAEFNNDFKAFVNAYHDAAVEIVQEEIQKHV